VPKSSSRLVNWEKTKLKNLVKLTSGSFLPSSNQKNGKIPVFGGNGVNGYHNESITENPTIIIGRVGAYCGSVHLSKKASWITDNAIFFKKIVKELDIEYLFKYLSRLNINVLAEVAAQPKISQGILNNILIQYPKNKNEQEKIVSILSSVDDLISSYDKTIESTKKLKKSLMQTLLTKGIGHKKFKKVHDRFRNEFEIPEEWMYVKIKNLLIDKKILEIQDGNHGELHPKSSDFIENGIPFITADCLIDNKINYSKCKYLDKKFLKTLRIGFAKVGDVILSHKGSIGNSSIMNEEYEEVILSPQTTYYRISDQINQHFLHYIFQSYDFQKQLKSFAKQSTRDYVGITNQQNLFIPFVSSKEEQQKIAFIISNVDDKITKLESKKKSAESLKKGLMQKLLTGQIRITV
jgi:type I restriction enzyme, S subunit